MPIQIHGAEMLQQMLVVQGALGSCEYLQLIQQESDAQLRNQEALARAPLIHLQQQFQIAVRLDMHPLIRQVQRPLLYDLGAMQVLAHEQSEERYGQGE